MNFNTLFSDFEVSASITLCKYERAVAIASATSSSDLFLCSVCAGKGMPAHTFPLQNNTSDKKGEYSWNL